jgi:phospholipid/cholesterol/gamma-HCH transport system permease protein
MESGPSASAVGEATTSAVVTSIVLIIGACGLFAVLFYILGI